ncbi:MAG: phospho-N-acetylmuramoyl-pentapeptide-transferase [Cyanobacteria bacterium J083]|nr:MAG: phospho-N-acetylmuramoyl-pentapeptide-transferase [Cyanobacteria bacterium J083]
MVEAKSSLANSLIKPSGKSLLILLGVILIAFSLWFDLTVGKSFSTPLSLTLPLIIAAGISGGLGYITVPILRKLKAGQVIQEDGLQSHLRKSGTPTMGGLFFIPVAPILATIWSGFAPEVIAVSLVTLAYAGIGWIDDWQILVQKSNKGISPRLKLILQIAIAVIFCLWLFQTQSPTITNVTLTSGVVLPLGIFFWPLVGFVLAAESNSTNLTDGVDGLAGGTGAIALLGLASLIAPTFASLAIFCAMLSGSCLGFVWHNHNPAKVFMGDTGSLALGGALAAVGVLTGNLWGLFIISGIFFVESLSVIAQVLYYKATKDENGQGKRLLKMAPIHHHLELTGWSETQIVGLFYLIALGLSLLTFFVV